MRALMSRRPFLGASPCERRGEAREAGAGDVVFGMVAVAWDAVGCFLLMGEIPVSVLVGKSQFGGS